MKAKSVMMLLRKDFRMSRMVFLVGVVTWPLPILFMWAMAYRILQTTPNVGRALSSAVVAGPGFAACVLLSGVLMAMIVGHLLTSERADRSAAFLSYLPASRVEALVSKMITAVTLAAAFVVLDLALVALASQLAHTHRFYLMRSISVLLAGGTMVLGSAWLAGVCFRSGAIATAMGIGLPVILWMGLWLEGMRDREVYSLFVTWSVVLGVLLFAAGVVVFLRKRPET